MERRYAKRDTKALYRHLDLTMEKLLEMGDLFDTQHSDLGDALRIIAKVILQAQNMLARFYATAWGSEPSNWQSK